MQIKWEERETSIPFYSIWPYFGSDKMAARGRWNLLNDVDCSIVFYCYLRQSLIWREGKGDISRAQLRSAQVSSGLTLLGRPNWFYWGVPLSITSSHYWLDRFLRPIIIGGDITWTWALLWLWPNLIRYKGPSNYSTLLYLQCVCVIHLIDFRYPPTGCRVIYYLTET